MKRFIFVFAILMLAASKEVQQPPLKIVWTQIAGSAAEAQGFVYTYYLAPGDSGVVLPNVTCAEVSSVITCSAPCPTFPDYVSLTLTASNLFGPSLRSAIVKVGPPPIPAGLRIER